MGNQLAAANVSPGIIHEATAMRAAAELETTYELQFRLVANAIYVSARCGRDEKQLGYIGVLHEQVPGTAKWRLRGEDWPTVSGIHLV